jgi:hypothetical protein
MSRDVAPDPRRLGLDPRVSKSDTRSFAITVGRAYLESLGKRERVALISRIHAGLRRTHLERARRPIRLPARGRGPRRRHTRTRRVVRSGATSRDGPSTNLR